MLGLNDSKSFARIYGFERHSSFLIIHNQAGGRFNRHLAQRVGGMLHLFSLLFSHDLHFKELEFSIFNKNICLTIWVFRFSLVFRWCFHTHFEFKCRALCKRFICCVILKKKRVYICFAWKQLAFLGINVARDGLLHSHLWLIDFFKFYISCSFSILQCDLEGHRKRTNYVRSW